MDRVAFARAVLELGHAAAEGLPVLGDVLELLDRAVGAEDLSVASFDALRGTHGQIAIRGGAPLTDVEQQEWMRLLPSHPYSRWLVTAPVLTSRLTDVVSMPEFGQSEVFQRLMRPRGNRYQSAMVLDRRRGAMTLIGLWRARLDFTDAEIETLELARGVLVAGLEQHAARERARRWAGPGLEASPLTPRQSEVAALVARGLTNEQVGRKLDISPRTVRKHLEDIFAATGCRSRTGVALWWHEGGRRAT